MMSLRNGMTRFVYHVVIYSLLLVFILPFLWMILASFKNMSQIMDLSKLIVFAPITENYKDVFIKYSFFLPISNSFFIGSLSVFFALILGLPSAYSISRHKQDLLAGIILIVRMIPAISLLVPMYIIFTAMNLVDTYPALVLTHILVALPFIIWVMIPYFEALPKELEQAAWVDGCSKAGTFFKIILPLSGPGIITASILSFIFSWNNFLFALILAGNKTKTLPVAVFSFISYAEVNWGGLMAAAVIITTPILLISIILQRYIEAIS